MDVYFAVTLDGEPTPSKSQIFDPPQGFAVLSMFSCVLESRPGAEAWDGTGFLFPLLLSASIRTKRPHKRESNEDLADLCLSVLCILYSVSVM